MTQDSVKNFKSDSFCINPFVEANVTPAGSVKPCCAWPEIALNGRPMSVYEHSVEEIWNSEALRSVRHKMIKGEPVSECIYCYNQEKAGARSMRLDGTQAWESGWLNPRGESVEDLRAKARAHDFRRPDGPEWIDLDVGNLCNLKCRMCNSQSSSSIVNDPVHSRWSWDFETPARWQGLAMVIAPKRVLGVDYEGISRLDHSTTPPMAWMQGAGMIRMKLPKEASKVEIKLRRDFGEHGPLEIFLNDLSMYRGELAEAPFHRRFDLPSEALAADELAIRIESTARVGIEELKLLRTQSGKSKVALSRLSSGKQWFQDEEFLFNDLLYKADNIVKMNFIGGEPLLIKEVRSIMKHIISLGLARDITLSATTNGTIADDEWRELAGQFKSVIIAVSLDGFGKVNDYIRYPSEWALIEPNIRRLQSIQNAYVYANMTVQAHNMLHVTALAQYCEQMDMDFRYHFLEKPYHLSCLVMPLEARHAAAQRIRTFAMSNAPDTTPRVRRAIDVRDTMLELAGILESNDRPVDLELLEEFMVFTNDLDQDRGQDFASINSELKDFIVASGAPWSSRTRFAKKA